MIVDASNLVLGRMCTFLAKSLLNGEIVEVVNADKALITGKKEEITERYLASTKRGEPFHGPFYQRRDDMLVRRTVRGMLPYKEARGRNAYKNLLCYVGVPENLKGKKFETVKDANVSRVKRANYMTIAELSKRIGKKSGRRPSS